LPKAWDIIGIKKKSTPSAPKKKKKQNCLFLLLIILAFLASVIFFDKVGANFLFESSTPAPSPSKNTSQNNPTLEIINGSGRFEETDKVSQIITSAGFQVSKTETSVNLTDKTIVYYESDYQNTASRLAAVLSSYHATIQAFSSPSSYNLAVIIGSQ